MTIGDRIRSARSACGISQTELAEKISVSKQTLYKYESGIVTNIPSDKIEAIAAACGTSPSTLMGWDKEINSDPLTPAERRLLEYYRRLPDVEGGMLIGYAERLFEESKGKDTTQKMA